MVSVLPVGVDLLNLKTVFNCATYLVREMTLGDVPVGSAVLVTAVGGEAGFRRRLMELGVLPGTRVEFVRVAPLGDPMELRVRGCALSVRRDQARSITVERLPAELAIRPPVESAETVGIAPGVPAAP